MIKTKFSNQNAALNAKKDYESRYGVKFDVYSIQGGKYNVTPIITRDIAFCDLEYAKTIAQYIPTYLNGGVDFATLSNKTGKSLADVMIMVKTLVYANIGYAANVNRLGNFAACYRRV